jgi:pimeloyl-ACP methyl ester carboxylesterase
MRTFAILLFMIISASGTRADTAIIDATVPSSRLIVFVHGIRSSAAATWTNEKTRAFWPQIVRQDPAFERSDIYVHDYRSSLDVDSASISDITKQMAADLDEKAKIKSYSNVVFVAHSMGGIVVRNYLLDQSRQAGGGVLSDDRVKGIYLFSTPMSGSAVADLGSAIFKSKTLWQLKTSNDPDAFLNSLRADWINAGLGTKVKSNCAFETVGVVNVFFWSKKVVEPSSVEPLCNAGFTGLPDRDHGLVAKPEDADAYPHLLLRQWYRGIYGDEQLATGDIVIASCDIDQYGKRSMEGFAASLFDISLSHYASLPLPKDWSKDAISLLWRGGEPKVVAIHFSCFQDGLGDEYFEERRVDFNNFLSDLADTKVKVVTYSRAFYKGFVNDNITRANRRAFVDSGRIAFLKLGFEPRRRAQEYKEFSKLVEKTATGKR